MESNLLGKVKDDGAGGTLSGSGIRKAGKPAVEPIYIKGRCLDYLKRRIVKTIKGRRGDPLAKEMETALYALLLRSAATLLANGKLREFDQDRCLIEVVEALELDEDETFKHCGEAARRLAFMDPDKISAIRKKAASDFTDRFMLKRHRFKGKWLVKVTAHNKAGFSQAHCSCCVEAISGDGSKPVFFHPCVEASLILSDCFDYEPSKQAASNESQSFSHGRRFLEFCVASVIMEDACDVNRHEKAFASIAEELVCWHGKLPICILAGSGFATDEVMGVCKENGWDFLLLMDDDPNDSLNMKFEDKISSGKVSERKQKIKTELPLKGLSKVLVRRTWANGIDHKGMKLSMSRLSTEESGEASIDLQWISSMRLNENDALRLNEYPGFDTYLEPELEADYNNMLTYNSKLDLSAAQNLLFLDQLADLFLRLDAAKVGSLNPTGIIKDPIRQLAQTLAAK